MTHRLYTSVLEAAQRFQGFRARRGADIQIIGFINLTDILQAKDSEMMRYSTVVGWIDMLIY